MIQSIEAALIGGAAAVVVSIIGACVTSSNTKKTLKLKEKELDDLWASKTADLLQAARRQERQAVLEEGRLVTMAEVDLVVGKALEFHKFATASELEVVKGPVQSDTERLRAVLQREVQKEIEFEKAKLQTLASMDASFRVQASTAHAALWQGIHETIKALVDLNNNIGSQNQSRLNDACWDVIMGRFSTLQTLHEQYSPWLDHDVSDEFYKFTMEITGVAHSTSMAMPAAELRALLHTYILELRAAAEKVSKAIHAHARGEVGASLGGGGAQG